MSPLPTLLVIILLTSLLPAPSSQLQCERKEIGRADSGSRLDPIPDPFGVLDCKKGPSWTGNLKYTLENTGFKDPISTYKIWWKDSVRRPKCVEGMSLRVNGREDVNAFIQQDHGIFKVTKPTCDQTSFTLKLVIYFKGLRLEDKCFEIETDRIFPEMPKLRDFLHLRQDPDKFANVENNQVKIFWRRKMFKLVRFENCVSVKLSTSDGLYTRIYEPDASIGRYRQFLTINGKCKEYNVSLVYIYNHNEKHRIQINIPAFPSMCGRRPSPGNPIVQDNDNVGFPTPSEETTNSNTYTSNKTSTTNNMVSFFTDDNYKGTIIVGSSFGCVLLLVAAIVTIVMLKKRTREQREEKMEERKDHNPIYGTYYDGPTYITVTDNNEMYE